MYCWVTFDEVLVSMPSRAYTSFLLELVNVNITVTGMCQCPLGLIPHFYPKSLLCRFDIYNFSCQCPLGLIPHFYLKCSALRYAAQFSVSMPSRAYTSFLQEDGRPLPKWTISVNALSGLYLISTVPLQKPRFYAASKACFCRYLSEYSDNSRFSCMLTFWTYLMRYTYP